MSPRFRSKIHNIQLLLLAKYSLVVEFGIDNILKPIVEDIRKLESVYPLYLHDIVHVHVHVTPAQLMTPGIGRNTSCALGDFHFYI